MRLIPTDHLTTVNTLLVIYGGNLLPINNELKAVEDRHDLERIQLNAAIPKLMEDLRGQEVGAAQAEQCVSEERSTLANAQDAQVEALRQALGGASAELKTIEDYRTAERMELKAMNEELIKERDEFRAFRHRVAELVQQLMAQTAEDKIRVEDLENPLVEQLRLLNENAVELGHLRSEIEIACEAEADLRRSAIETEGRANTAIQNLKSETAKLQASIALTLSASGLLISSPDPSDRPSERNRARRL